MVLVNILLMPAKLKIVMLRKPAGFLKILHYVMISRHEVFVNNLYVILFMMLTLVFH